MPSSWPAQKVAFSDDLRNRLGATCVRVIDIVCKRGTSYGDPASDHARTAKMWEGLFGIPVPVWKVPIALLMVKVSRECHTHTPDNWDDMGGYWLNGVACVESDDQTRPPVEEQGTS